MGCQMKKKWRYKQARLYVLQSASSNSGRDFRQQTMLTLFQLGGLAGGSISTSAHDTTFLHTKSKLYVLNCSNSSSFHMF